MRALLSLLLLPSLAQAAPCTSSSLSPKIRWAPAAGAETYRLEFTDAAGTKTLVDVGNVTEKVCNLKSGTKNPVTITAYGVDSTGKLGPPSLVSDPDYVMGNAGDTDGNGALNANDFLVWLAAYRNGCTPTQVIGP